MYRLLTALTSATLLATPAFAIEQWEGLYTGVSIGVGFNPGDNGELEFKRADGSDNEAAIDAAFGDNVDGKFNAGSLTGVELGYNLQQGQWVYGAELSIALADLSQEQSAFSATPATYVERREINTLSTLTARIAYATDSPFLPYVKLGAAYGDVDYSWQGNSGAFRGDNGDDDRNIGYLFGVGVEAKLTKQLSAAFEYQYIDLGDADFSTNFSSEQSIIGGNNGAFNAFGDAASGGTNAQGSDDDFDFQAVRVALRYHF